MIYTYSLGRGHLELLAKVEKAAKENTPGLFLGGNYKTGVAFGDCIQYGADVSKDILAYLKDSASVSEGTTASPAPVAAASISA